MTLFGPPAPPTLRDTISVGRQFVLDNRDDGVKCPCCDQLAKTYQRPLNVGMTVALIKLYRATVDGGFVHLPTLTGRSSGEESKPALWGLMQEENRVREDGGRAGYWRISDLGAHWLNLHVTVPKYVRIYDGQRLGDPYGEPWTPQQALGVKFDLRELMSA